MLNFLLLLSIFHLKPYGGISENFCCIMNNIRDNRLLVIDDDIGVRTSICMYMEDQGYKVFEASNGEEGLRLVVEMNPAMVFCDLRLPGLDGLDVLQRITSEHPGTPIIVISGAGRIQDVVEALRRGAWNYISKPIENMAVLKHVAEQALEKAMLQRENLQYHAYLEKEVVRRTRELVKSTARAKILAEEANAANCAKGEFLSNMSHELRTPLNSIVVLARVLAENRQQNLNDKQVEMLEQISSSGHELLGLVNEVLDVAEFESSQVQLDKKMISIRKFVTRIDRIASPLAWQKGLAYYIELADDAPEKFYSDESKVSRIIRSIISNAVKFTREGSIRIRFGRPPAELQINNMGYARRDLVMIQISDTGIGIEPEVRQRIFSAFMQADGADTRRYQGVGLGLAIAARFTSALGGEILLESEPGKGSTFTVVLPASADMATYTVRQVSRMPVSSYLRSAGPGFAENVRFNGERILIADDDMRVVFNMSAMLETLGAEALISSSEDGIVQRLYEAFTDELHAIDLLICIAEKLTPRVCTAIESLKQNAPEVIVLTSRENASLRDSLNINCHFLVSPPTYDKIVPLIQRLL